MDELLTMSNEEITRLEVMQRLKDKRLLQKEAARMLGISIRQVKRLYPLCAYNGETIPPHNLVLRAEEKNHVSGTEW